MALSKGYKTCLPVLPGTSHRLHKDFYIFRRNQCLVFQYSGSWWTLKCMNTWIMNCGHFLSQIEKLQANLQAVSEQKSQLEAELQRNIEMVRGCLWSNWCHHIDSHVKGLKFCLCVWVNRKFATFSPNL